MRDVVIIHKFAHSIVVAPSDHAGRCSLRLELLLVDRLVLGIGRIAADHLLHLVADAVPLDVLHVLEPREDLMLHLEGRLHAEAAAFFDREGLVLERVERVGRLEVDYDVRTAVDLFCCVRWIASLVILLCSGFFAAHTTSMRRITREKYL
jgi:hypothetical protein